MLKKKKKVINFKVEMGKGKTGGSEISQNCSAILMESQQKLPQVDKLRNRIIYISFKVIMVSTSKTLNRNC